VTDGVVATREGVVVDRTSAVLQPCQDAGPRGLYEFELDGSSGLPLYDRHPDSLPAAANEIADPDLNHVTTAQLVVDGEVEVTLSRSRPSRSSQNLIAQTCCGLSGRLAPGYLPAFHGRRLLESEM
jgi:hypothetical protein